MSAYLSKNGSLDQGVEPLHINSYAISTDCKICLEPLVVNKTTAAPRPGFHAAIKIKACGHVHGEICLMEWLKVGSSCPTCQGVLFPSATDQLITQADFDAILKALGPRFGERSVRASLVRMVLRKEETLRDRLARDAKAHAEATMKKQKEEEAAHAQRRAEAQEAKDWFAQEDGEEEEQDKAMVEGYESDDDVDGLDGEEEAFDFD